MKDKISQKKNPSMEFLKDKKILSKDKKILSMYKNFLSFNFIHNTTYICSVIYKIEGWYWSIKIFYP